MVSIDIEYEGDLHCKATHGPSGAVITTDAPVDNQGKGAAFSPTDLFATSLGICMMTVMGIYARRKEIDLRGSRVHVTKEMATDPVRRGRPMSAVPPMEDMPSRCSECRLRAISCHMHRSK